jgi:hypothetical protein
LTCPVCEALPVSALLPAWLSRPGKPHHYVKIRIPSGGDNYIIHDNIFKIVV